MKISLIALATILAVTACHERKDPDRDQIFSDIKTQTGMLISTNAEVLKAGDAESREPGYYEWSLYLKAPERFNFPHMPKADDTSMKETIIKVVESNLQVRIDKPLEAFFSIWHNGTTQCQGSIVHTKVSQEVFRIGR